MSKRQNHVAAVVDGGHVLEWIAYADHAREIDRLTSYEVEWFE